MAANNEFSAGRSRSPYRVEVAPGWEPDVSSKMYQIFRAQRGEEEARNTQKKRLIGTLDTMGSEFISMFGNLNTIRKKLQEAEYDPMIDEEQIKTLKKLQILVDKINSAIVNRAIPMIDSLGK